MKDQINKLNKLSKLEKEFEIRNITEYEVKIIINAAVYGKKARINYQTFTILFYKKAI